MTWEAIAICLNLLVLELMAESFIYMAERQRRAQRLRLPEYRVTLGQFLVSYLITVTALFMLVANVFRWTGNLGG